MVVSGSPILWYISGIYCQVGEIVYHRSHLFFGDPETTIDFLLGGEDGELKCSIHFC